jgi:hypothetical protein
VAAHDIARRRGNLGGEKMRWELSAVREHLFQSSAMSGICTSSLHIWTSLFTFALGYTFFIGIAQVS